MFGGPRRGKVEEPEDRWWAGDRQRGGEVRRVRKGWVAGGGGSRAGGEELSAGVEDEVAGVMVGRVRGAVRVRKGGVTVRHGGGEPAAGVGGGGGGGGGRHEEEGGDKVVGKSVGGRRRS
jgi:hypothetical protein